MPLRTDVIMIVVSFHRDPVGTPDPEDLEQADAVLTAYADGEFEVVGDSDLIDFTLPLRSWETREVLHFWDAPERWARALVRHAHYRGWSVRAVLVADVCVPDGPLAA